MGLITYIKEVRGELKHVSWPTRKQALYFTAIVIAISLATAYYLGAFDLLFTRVLDTFVL